MGIRSAVKFPRESARHPTRLHAHRHLKSNARYLTCRNVPHPTSRSVPHLAMGIRSAVKFPRSHVTKFPGSPVVRSPVRAASRFPRRLVLLSHWRTVNMSPSSTASVYQLRSKSPEKFVKKVAINPPVLFMLIEEIQ